MADLLPASDDPPIPRFIVRRTFRYFYDSFSSSDPSVLARVAK